MSNPPLYEYRPVDRAKREIRVLGFAETDSNAQPSIVHCTLENVSLDDFAPEFAQYIAKDFGSSCSPAATTAWHKDHLKGKPWQTQSGSSTVLMPVWRRDSDCMEWDHLALSLGIDTSTLPPPPLDINEYIRQSSLCSFNTSFIGTGCASESTPNLTNRDSNQLFNLITRFKWGDFETVSYCWESEVRENSISIDGLPFMVPRCVDTVLRRLRNLPEAKSGMKFWIDFICINQDDVLEKNHQVNMMRDIYASAFAVIVWLGESEDGSTNAIDHMTQIMQIEAEILRGQRFETSTYDEWFSVIPWHEIYSFLVRKYWTRLWIIQELALNHNATLFLCGDRQLTRRVIAMATSFCRYRENSGRVGTILATDNQNYSISERMTFFFSISYRVNRLLWLDASLEAASLDHILDLGQSAQSKDPRDKVYGLLGLLPKSLRSRIQPDYSPTVSRDDVYRQMCEALLIYTGRTDSVLSWCHFCEKSSLPSWVPDWTVKFPRNHVQWLKKRNASRSTSPNWSISADGYSLSCKGIIVDIINSLSSSPSETIPFGTARAPGGPMEPPKGSRYREKDLRDVIQKTLSNDHPRIRQGCSTIESILWVDWDIIKTATDDYDGWFHDFWIHLNIVIRDPQWESFDRFRQTNANFSIFGIQLRDFFPEMRSYLSPSHWSARPGTRPITEDDVNNMALMAISIVGRRLATTHTGYLGLVPEEAHQGDCIAVIYGCNFPVVLRPRGDHFKVVGECYVNGLMDGEAMEAKSRGEYEEAELLLY